MHPLDRFSHDGETDASSLVLAGPVYLLKQFEQPLLSVRLNADAVIHKPEANFAVDGFAEDLDAWLGSASHKLHRVVQKVGDTLSQRNSVADQLGQGSLDLDVCPGLLKLWPFLHDLTNELFHIDGSEHQFLPRKPRVS